MKYTIGRHEICALLMINFFFPVSQLSCKCSYFPLGLVWLMISVLVSLKGVRAAQFPRESEWWWWWELSARSLTATLTHSHGSRCPWIPARTSSWSSRRAGSCSGRGGRTRWTRCATPSSGCRWSPRQPCSCQLLQGKDQKEVVKRESVRFWIPQQGRCEPTLTVVGFAVVLELRAGSTLVVVRAAAVEITLPVVALSLVVARVGAARVTLNLEWRVEGQAVSVTVQARQTDRQLASWLLYKCQQTL